MVASFGHPAFGQVRQLEHADMPSGGTHEPPLL